MAWKELYALFFSPPICQYINQIKPIHFPFSQNKIVIHFYIHILHGHNETQKAD
jgi:hypothetical protein